MDSVICVQCVIIASILRNTHITPPTCRTWCWCTPACRPPVFAYRFRALYNKHMCVCHRRRRRGRPHVIASVHMCGGGALSVRLIYACVLLPLHGRCCSCARQQNGGNAAMHTQNKCEAKNKYPTELTDSFGQLNTHTHALCW